MSEIDAKVNMSLDEIIKMGKKEKKSKKPTVKQTRGNAARGRGGFRNRGGRKGKQNGVAVQAQKPSQGWRLNQNQVKNPIRGGFVNKRTKRNTLTRSRSNLNLSRVLPKSVQRGGGFASRRGRVGRVAVARSRSRNNVNFAQGGFFTGNKTPLKRTNSLPNLRDPTSVHNRLGYQSPAQMAYRNRVKRAKQMLLQLQRLNHQQEFAGVPQAGKRLTTLQQRALERRQQSLTTQRRFTGGGLHSDQIVRAQRHAQYEQKMMRMNNAHIMCEFRNDYVRGMRQRSMSLSRNQATNINNLRQLRRGRSPFRQSMQNLNLAGRGTVFVQQPRRPSRSRSRSRSRGRVVPAAPSTGPDVDDRTFSEVMYSLSGNLGVTGRTLNDRFSF